MGWYGRHDRGRGYDLRDYAYGPGGHHGRPMHRGGYDGEYRGAWGPRGGTGSYGPGYGYGFRRGYDAQGGFGPANERSRPPMPARPGEMHVSRWHGRGYGRG